MKWLRVLRVLVPAIAVGVLLGLMLWGLPAPVDLQDAPAAYPVPQQTIVIIHGPP